MADVTERQILDALGRIRDPQRGGDIVSLGMVAGLVIRNGNVGFAIEVDAERGPALEPLRQAAEKAVEALPGVLSVTAVLTAQAGDGHRSRASAAPPPGAHDHRGHTHHDHGHSHPNHGHGAGPTPVARSGAPATAPAAGNAKAMVPGVQAIVAVASGKGGVGKSTVAANLALALKANGLSVGILDADIYGPSVPRMLGISGRPDSDGKKLKPMESFGLRCMSMGFLVPEDTAMIWRGPMVMSALQQMLRDVSWGELDILIVDMPPGTGDAQ